MATKTVMDRILDANLYATNQTHHEKPESLTRYLGGHNRSNHPYTSGYWQLYLNPPVTIFKGMHQEAIDWFHCTAESFQPPSRNLNKADVPGQGGLGASYITGQTLNRTFSVTHREWRDLPIQKFYELWTSIIDPYTGVSEVKGANWTSKAYKGCGFVALTKPVGSYINETLQPGDIEEVYFFHGIFPEAAPTESFASDIQGNDVLQLNINFSFDGWPLTKVDNGVVNQFLKLTNSLRYMKTYDSYVKDIVNGVSPDNINPQPRYPS